MSGAIVPPGSMISEPAAVTRPGYTFCGWYRESSCATPWNFSADTVEADTTLYAKWQGNTYTVTFNAQDGTVSPAQKSVTNGSVYGTLPNPSKNGVVFKGWYTGENGAGTRIGEDTAVDITGDQTLYAFFEALSTPAITVSSKGYNIIGVAWGAVPGATGYNIYESASASGTYSLAGAAAGTSYTVSPLGCGTRYYFKVQAFCQSGSSRIYSAFSPCQSAVPKPSAPSAVKAVKASSTSIRISWSGVSGASGYKVYLVKSSGTVIKTLKTVFSRSYKITGLKKGRKYYYKIRAYRKVGSKNINGGYSKTVSMKL